MTSESIRITIGLDYPPYFVTVPRHGYFFNPCEHCGYMNHSLIRCPLLVDTSHLLDLTHASVDKSDVPSTEGREHRPVHEKDSTFHHTPTSSFLPSLTTLTAKHPISSSSSSLSSSIPSSTVSTLDVEPITSASISTTPTSLPTPKNSSSRSREPRLKKSTGGWEEKRHSSSSTEKSWWR